MLTSYHNHTTWSDGDPSIAEQLEAAVRCGLNEVGISDHYVLRPVGRQVDWSMPIEKLADYVAELQTQTLNFPGVAVRIGIEADFFPETVEELRKEAAKYPFDFIIGSVHFVDGFPIDSDAADWATLKHAQVDHYWRRYWQRIREMAESGVFDFAAHLDLPKKFGFKPAGSMTSESNAALDALAKAGMAIEINTAGWYKPVNEAYPSLAILRAAKERDIPLLINSDAHETAHLTRDFERARALAREAGYSELVRYESRIQTPVPL
jgi:histidinol-phosphatase (PHP family)